MDGETECPICMEKYDDNVHKPVLTQACGHSFCNECLTTHCDQLVNMRVCSCPLCRRDLY